jgi:hypothetical protein
MIDSNSFKPKSKNRKEGSIDPNDPVVQFYAREIAIVTVLSLIAFVVVLILRGTGTISSELLYLLLPIGVLVGNMLIALVACIISLAKKGKLDTELSAIKNEFKGGRKDK